MKCFATCTSKVFGLLARLSTQEIESVTSDRDGARTAVTFVVDARRAAPVHVYFRAIADCTADPSFLLDRFNL